MTREQWSDFALKTMDTVRAVEHNRTILPQNNATSACPQVVNGRYIIMTGADGSCNKIQIDSDVLKMDVHNKALFSVSTNGNRTPQFLQNSTISAAAPSPRDLSTTFFTSGYTPGKIV